MSEARIEVDTGTGELLCEIRDRVAVITLNRPEARNALSDRLTPALRRMIKQCGDDPNVGGLLITGTPAISASPPNPPSCPPATSASD
jgi:enoyl-CoA hydratase/carnithine racemase